jgi:serine/threonine-protein kinase
MLMPPPKDVPPGRGPGDQPTPRIKQPSGELEPYDEGGLAAGTFVGEYRIEALIGEGGMGTVYRALQPVIGKKVAIKVLAGVLSRDGNAIKRFALEARAVNEIGHRNLVDIFSFGRLPDGRHYYVMEFLDGHSLGEALRQRERLPASEVFPLFRDIGRALAAAHGKGIIHRDLKPDNVILVADPDQPENKRAKLLDFGVAKLLEQDVPGAPKTQAGATLGTPQYMAPEQCVGGKIDARTDIYALGVMFFQVLTGRVPFEGASVIEIWQGHVGKPPPRLGDLAPDIENSPQLEALVLQMLAKDPQKRLQSASQFCEALDAVSPTLGMPPARSAREPRLSNPLVKPSTEVVMAAPGGLPRPDTQQLRVMAASFEVNHLTDVISLDEAIGGASGAFPAPAPPERNAPSAIPSPYPPMEAAPPSIQLPGLPGLVREAEPPRSAARDPYSGQQSDGPDIDLERPAPTQQVSRFRNTVPVGSGVRRGPTHVPAPRQSEGGGRVFVIIAVVLVALAIAAAVVISKKRAAPAGDDVTPAEEKG